MNRRGSVLVFVLIFISFAVSVVLFMHERSGESLAETASLQEEYQTSIFAMTAVEAIRELLEDDGNNYDDAGEDWGLLPMIPIPGGYVSISIKPLNGRLNLNMLDEEQDEEGERILAGCVHILEELDINADTCAMIKDWLDTDSEMTAGGEESFRYDAEGKEYLTKNGALETLHELRYINRAGEHYGELAQYFTIGGDSKVNLNFVSEEVLAGAVPALEPYAGDIIKYREQHVYKDVSNIREAAEIPDDIYNDNLKYLSVKSSLFYVKTEVTLGENSRFYHVLLQRNGKKTKLLKYIEGTDAPFF
ncbi:general secretion pathway protein GspK [Limisalsivibrio acetivorans]|uniref:general secretion pathway protein GspK n=1 Tax=Limisalsivibrio acetivorans TaxID=1304888 RepID=UPI0003B7A56A|nr:type II secretion system protein GspK [Limisalsivibrio acetivorans]